MIEQNEKPAPTCSGKHTKEECAKGLQALEDTFYVIGGKWKLKIINALRIGGSSRFNQLQQTVTGISARILSKELKELELNGFIKRNVYTETPVVVTYEITPYSNTLGPVLSTLIEWGTTHRNKIKNDYKELTTSKD
ncbi:DNA-binding HxlR family transcriptional regulator [Pedobacter cryoconitis]|uniref:DNA-binding HxlR family transcriptional regulator n=1 Tax=Pedobacter cryoconitis TaxID=188932 RepID=A0A7W8ZNV3_9SPHI|nr:helix-turn-helix domain-containing protein [Pedobacter cryoconitis]MBB5637250.1 DNA-binding HxlR family transcriptional regulator [Pedobacter cryoconitis]MBB6274010.1 DNA-binding HxlR family transcriptional regulator [Pedobacter cryoconitis]